MPDGWAWSRVRTIASVKGGKRVPKGYSVTDEKTNHAYIRVTDMKNNTISLDSLKFISDDVYSKISTYVISKNDIYVTIAGTIGNVGEVPDELDGMNLTENAVKVCNISIDKSYLCKVLSSDFVQKQFRFQTHQVTMAKLALERILDTLIPIAPLYEQNRINHRVFELTKQIEELQCSKYKLQSLITSTKSKILDLAIRGKLVPQDPNDEPASVLLERIRAEKEQLIKQGKIKRDKKESVIFKGDDNSYYEDLPCQWVETKLSTISEVITKGTTPRGGKVAYADNGIGFLRAENIAGYEKLALNNLNYVDEKSHNGFLKRSILKANDILITIAGTLGRTAVVPCEALPLNTNQAVAIVRLVNCKLVNVRFIIFAINSPTIKKDLLMQSVDMAIPNLSLENISNCTIPLPPLAEQRRIVNTIEALFAQIDKIAEQIS